MPASPSLSASPPLIALVNLLPLMTGWFGQSPSPMIGWLGQSNTLACDFSYFVSYYFHAQEMSDLSAAKEASDRHKQLKDLQKPLDDATAQIVELQKAQVGGSTK